MRYPSIMPRLTRHVSVPQLSGGVNARDNPSYIGDHQLTECDNMFFSMGRLRTRPGICFKKAQPVDKADKIVKTSNGALLINKEGKVTYVSTEDDEITVTQNQFNGVFSHTHAMVVANGNGQNGHISFVKQSDNELYSIGVKHNNGALELISTAVYIPTVIINSVGNNDPLTYSVNGDYLEGYNLLTDSYIMLATANGNKCWHLPKAPKGGETITIELNDPRFGEITHVLTLPNELDTSDEALERYQSSNGYNASYVDKSTQKTVTYKQKIMYNARDNCVMFLAQKGGETGYYFTVAPVSVGAYKNSSSNMRITISSNLASNTSKTILGMQSSIWFGGSRGGMGGGTRLFVAGNPDESGAIHWSDLKKPSYFSENNYAYVGDGSPITALAQQDDMLIIFQQNAITMSEYVQTQSASAEQIMNGSAVDVTTLGVTFPLTPVHSTIGCDCPDTISLCSNRLVWLTSEGKVYTLVNYGQYNERNVRELSYAIEPLLKAHSSSELKKAKSADLDGRYCLFIGNKVYLLDYANQMVGSSSTSSRSSIGSVWYVWTLPEFINGVDTALVSGDRLIIVSDQSLYELSFNKSRIELLDFDGNKSHPIKGSFTTKLFNFGAPDRLKRVDKVSLALGKADATVTVSSVVSSEAEELSTIVISEQADSANRSVQYETLYPDARGVPDFGVKISADSAISVESMTITYKETGDLK